MERQALEELFAVSEQHIIDGKQLVKELRTRIAVGEMEKHDTSATRRLLESHLKIQAVMESDHKLLLCEILKLDAFPSDMEQYGSKP